MVVVGAPHDGAVGGLFDMALTGQLIRHSPGQVHVVLAEVSQQAPDYGTTVTGQRLARTR